MGDDLHGLPQVDAIPPVGIQIRNAREARKMTQSQLAGKIGKERSFISKVEREGSNLTLSTLYDIVTKGLGGTLDIQVRL